MLKVHSTLSLSALLLPVMLLLAGPLLAAGGTSKVAVEGRATYISPAWPAGVADLLADPARTDGWNDWFSEWPSDVNHYQFDVRNTADINRLLAKLADIKGARHVRLSPTAEPRGLGWVTSLKEGNNTAVLFSIGDQQRIDQWYQRLNNGKFGVMHFEKTPVAVPPTLTIFVRNEAVRLDELEIPAGIDVSAGSCPRLFHESNLQCDKAERKAAKDVTLDAETQRTMESIDDYLKRRSG